MPRFSVIVPVFRVQAYLHECLASVLEQSFTDLEVIAVDDCSPDACGEIIDEFAARDSRVKAVHLDENVGLGRARNAGLRHATGDYVLFLDSDDTFAPGALHAIADRIKETGSPDVLHFDYARTFWDGREVRNQFAHLLSQEGPAPFQLAERPALLRILMVVWNKAYNREFIEREGFSFPPGYYEDTPWTYPVLMASETVATLDRVCVHYRQRRQGNILGTTTAKHFDIFDQYERVFDFLDQHPDLDERWRPVMFRRMVDHLSTIFTKRGRLPRRSRAEFLRRSRAHYARYRVPGARVPLRTRLRHALVRLGSHRTYRALWTALRVKQRASRYAATARRTLRAAALQLHYRVQLRLPVRENEAVFTSYWGRGHGCNPGALEEAFREHAPQVRTAWIAAPEHHHTIPTATRRLTPGTAAYWTALARSKYLVNNVNFDRRLVKRPGQVLVQTQHGTPLKKMGLDLQDHPAAARGTDFGQLLRSVDKWDYVLSSNRHSTLVWERVFPSSYTTLEYGYPRNDRLRKATSQEIARIRETLGIPREATAILYAPTHRDYRITQRLTLDLERMLRTLGPRFVILTRAHHAYAEPLARAAGGRLIDVSDHPSIESLCLAADALVTDYSSVMFDYACLDRPIVIHADDWEAYEAARGTYFDLRSFPPGAIARSEDELIDIFATGHWRGSRSAQLRTAFRERFCGYDDGRAGERVVRHLVFGETASAAAPGAGVPRQSTEVSAPSPTNI
ncbi:glycosyltransferase [Streptomyces sp. SID8379]|uniref:bifunctional glycosyltransferase/CDP-glycerol:glycerophosphate glycerophosphotransferase n=1 Tax=unclassified Streptomyces TaxID=2593676 RepID=UPI00036A7862|nr:MULTISPECIES: bifunctional glycosyltransferase family 2 protein/CDP-glycerol:glycerophosphate glycerophosphotransferase [unclassified Streptomyces]MYW64732.1 glycosyltransferase [Streptomyces sp. SID8379]